MTVDMREPEGRDILLRLLRDEQRAIGLGARLLSQGHGQAATARALHISEEHFSRRWKPLLLRLLVEKLLPVNSDAKYVEIGLNYGNNSVA